MTLTSRILLVFLLGESGHLSKGIRAAAFLSITFVLLAGGCDHPRSTPEGATVTKEVSPALVGSQITIRGTFSRRCKVPVCILLDNQQAVDIEPRGSSWREPESYSEMEGKLVTATGILRFYHNDAKPTALPVAVARPVDHFYFEAETAQLRLIRP
jgi:hypothetical protein